MMVVPRQPGKKFGGTHLNRKSCSLWSTPIIQAMAGRLNRNFNFSLVECFCVILVTSVQ
jgi:hypothetical protein